MNTNTQALREALDLIDEIVLAGMSGSGQESEEGMRDFHAQQAWNFISIAARAKEKLRAALSQPPAPEQASWGPNCDAPLTPHGKRMELIRRLRNTPNWLRESYGSWKDCVSRYDRAPFEAADMLEADAATPTAEPAGEPGAVHDVRKILLDVVPGFDGEGVEVYAESVAEVETRLGEMGRRLEDFELGITVPTVWRESLQLIESVLRGYPESIARADALQSVRALLLRASASPAAPVADLPECKHNAYGWETAAPEAAKPEQQAQAGEPLQWTLGPNLFKDWCSRWFGPDADDSHLAKAAHDLPLMANPLREAIAKKDAALLVGVEALKKSIDNSPANVQHRAAITKMQEALK